MQVEGTVSNYKPDRASRGFFSAARLLKLGLCSAGGMAHDRDQLDLSRGGRLSYSDLTRAWCRQTGRLSSTRPKMVCQRIGAPIGAGNLGKPSADGSGCGLS